MKAHEKIRANKIRRAIRSVDCADCGAVALTPCVSKDAGTEIRGVHKARQIMAFAQGYVIQGESTNGLSAWSLP